MKGFIYTLYMILITLGAFPSFDIPATSSTGGSDDFRAVWVSTVINLDFPSRKGLSTAELKREIDSIISESTDIGLNAIILQVRPSGDALYKSSIFPWSEYITGTQGIAPAGGFDPLAYWIEQAHKNGLELHAWINPYRVTHTTAKITDVNKLYSTNPARQNPSRAIAFKDALYLDPGLPENRTLVIDGIVEIIKNYDVDGIHLDDYFYPETTFPDDGSYAKYGAGMKKDDWRRENVSELIRGIQKAVRNTNPDVRFGVSPFAIWQNSSSDPLGSDTRGNEAYKNMYADTRRWVKEGWLDYICPQIYWYSGYEIADYRKVLAWWADVCKGTGVDLYVGHAAYKEFGKAANWEGEIVRQLQLNETVYSDIVKGSAFFRYGSLKGTVGDQLKVYYANKASNTDYESPKVILPVAPIKTSLSAVQPSGNVTVTEKSYNIFGTSNPNKPLLMNGNAVPNRTPEGFYNIYVSLSNGTNTFKFTQEGQTAVTRIITLRAATATAVPTMKTAAITSVFPAKDEYVSTGDKMTFKCTAPVSAKVTVQFNGGTLELKDDNASRNAQLDNKNIYSTTYSAAYTVPASGNQGEVTELGKPIYSMTYNGKTYTNSGASVRQIGKNAPYYATVTTNFAWVYPGATTTGGAGWQLLKGQKDAVTAISRDGAWVRLSTGLWIENKNVNVQLESRQINGLLTGGTYSNGDAADTIKWKASQYPALNVTYDGKELIIYFPLHASVPDIGLSQGEVNSRTMFKSMRTGVDSGVPYYAFTVKDGTRVEGYYASFSNGEFTLTIKKTRALTQGSKPLKGFTIVIDAGHGGNDSGAVGMLGGSFAEKHINLINAVKLGERLESLGAKVVQVRTTDVFYSLEQRVEISRNVKPDMFIAMHANSVAESTNASNVKGISFWYKNQNSKPLADHLINELFKVNPLTTRRQVSNQATFYVMRPTWCPSVLIEASFMCNIEDFAWMINTQNQDELADKTAQAILSYYR